MSEWISVKDRMPEINKKVLVCGRKGGIYTARWRGEYEGWKRLASSEWNVVNPTHWMPLPPKPKKEG